MTLDEAERDYRVILCDIWGCIHDGVSLYPGAADRPFASLEGGDPRFPAGRDGVP